MQLYTSVNNKSSNSIGKAGMLLLATMNIANAEPHAVQLVVLPTQNELIDRIRQNRSGDVAVRIASNDTEVLNSENAVLSTKDMLEVVLNGLGLGMSDLEQVLKVKRATLYNWRKGGDVKGEESLDRLKSVYSIAEDISKFNSKPFGRRAKTLLIDGKSYLDLLMETTLNEKMIRKHASILASHTNARLQSSQRFKPELNDIENISGAFIINAA